MKIYPLIPGLIFPFLLAACEKSVSEFTKEESGPKDAQVEAVETEENTAGKNSEEPPVETVDQGGEVSGAVIGAAAGGIIGHQSGTALEGAVIGGALGGAGAIEEIDSQPDQVEEE